METQDLIKALSADAGSGRASLPRTWAAAVTAAIVLAAIVFFEFIGPRADIAAAAETVRFLFKFVVTILLAATAFAALTALARPEKVAPARLALIVVAPLVLLTALAIELAMVPASDWATRLVGTNMRYCLTFIPMIGIGPLALFILALRRAAPGRPPLAGAVAGLAAGGIAATFYAAHCTDDFPIFVTTWYTIAILILTGIGAVAGKVFARW